MMNYERILLAVTLALVLCGCRDTRIAEPPPDVEVVTLAHEFVDRRFYRIDLPERDAPGRETPGQFIDVASILVFRMIEPTQAQPSDVFNVAAYVDTTGVFWSTELSPANDFQDPAVVGAQWRSVPFEIRWTPHGEPDCLDFGEELDYYATLAIVYDVVDPTGALLYTAGDRPGRDETSRVDLPGSDGPFYRMKLLKVQEGFFDDAFHYEVRNIYDLGLGEIEPFAFSLAIERAPPYSASDQDENGIPYIRLFGLDRFDNATGALGHDGRVDLMDPFLFDLEEGLLRFPDRHPFNAGEIAHRVHADAAGFLWDDTYLATHQAPELYDPTVPSWHLELYSDFQLRAVHAGAPTGSGR